MADGMAKNWEVVKQELSDYRVNIAIVMDKVKQAKGIGRKLHHLSGLGPDIHRLMPRTLWYGGWVLSLILALVAGWIFFV